MIVDVSSILRTRMRRWVWISLPLLTPLALTSLGGWYCSSVRTKIAWQRSFFECMPELRATLDTAERVVTSSFMVARAPHEAQERLNKLIPDKALATGFTLQSVRFQEGRSSQRSLWATVQGEGDLESVLKFVGELERVENLMALSKAMLSGGQGGGRPRYQAELVFEYLFNPK